MNKIDYNSKYKFISNGTWFIKGSEVIVEDGNCLWGFGEDGKEISYEDLINNKDKISGLFRGNRICEDESSEGCPVGTLREDDGEMCSLEEFKIIIK